MIYNWRIDDLIKKPSIDGLNDVVVSVMFTCMAEDETTGKKYNYHHVARLPPPSQDTFTDFNSLSKEEVKGWVLANVDVDHVYSVIAERINIAPGDGLTVPWGYEEHHSSGN